jgi:hypothetical protein
LSPSLATGSIPHGAKKAPAGCGWPGQYFGNAHEQNEGPPMRALMIAQLKLIRTAPVLTNTIGVLQATDAIPRKADIRLRSNIRRCGPMLLKKSFWEVRQIFSEALVRRS